MKNYFDITKKHTIIKANRSKYAIPVLHPNRIMDVHDFIYMVEGKWKIGQDGEEFYIEKGDVLILAANHSHYGIDLCTAGTKTLFIHTERLDGDEYETNKEKVILESHIKAQQNPAVKDCFEKIVFAFSCQNHSMASAYFDVLLCELESLMNKSLQDNIAENMRRMIISSTKILKNREIANAFNLSLKTAENIFKKAFNTTLHKYVIDRKIEEIMFHLVNFPDMTLYEIALNLGFYDEFHMSRLFKKNVGISPGEYRKTQSKRTTE